MKKSARASILVFVALCVSALAAGQKTAAQATPDATMRPKKPVYVQDFVGARAGQKASQSAGQLSADVVKEFTAQGFTAKRLEPGATLPTDGWLVRGTFYATDSGGNIIPTELLGGEQKPNTQLTVSVANLSKDPNAPFIVFGKAEALKGQGAPVGWNPYVVAAKFVINQVESATDLEKLAGEIVQTIMTNKEIVEQKALASNQ
jgi:hypothetical protein